MIKLVAAKQKIGIPANSEIALVLKSKLSFKIGISGLITTNPARIFNDAKKIGVPVFSLLLIFDPSDSLNKRSCALGKSGACNNSKCQQRRNEHCNA